MVQIGTRLLLSLHNSAESQLSEMGGGEFVVKIELFNLELFKGLVSRVLIHTKITSGSFVCLIESLDTKRFFPKGKGLASLVADSRVRLSAV